MVRLFSEVVVVFQLTWKSEKAEVGVALKDMLHDWQNLWSNEVFPLGGAMGGRAACIGRWHNFRLSAWLYTRKIQFSGRIFAQEFRPGDLWLQPYSAQLSS